MSDQEIIATCGCVCDLDASWNWVDESICDVEINIRIPCEYHRHTTQDTPDISYRRCPACNALLEERSVYCDTCGTDTPRAADSAPPYTYEELDIITDPRRNSALKEPPVAGSVPISGNVRCQECGAMVDVDDAESVYNAELDDVYFFCSKCMGTNSI